MERKFVRNNKRGSKLNFIQKNNAIAQVSKFKQEKKCKI